MKLKELATKPQLVINFFPLEMISIDEEPD